ncbi:GDP-mannose 4,6-dehydratase [Halorussus salilacus]|uniref:GDP-mannose 4,6-dehydratase n=1 Tax=Halorussus salilacus TaxID=2953750 RepID=UPI00209CE2B8|nr:GDP-mannose 4,6-dehydratase [Halorussus salilacus]USZ67388.1 GDP-mannose 4,6-dehydratase [Halorussus salilacus]
MAVLDDLSGFEFEDLMEDAFRNLGYENVRQAEKTADEALVEKYVGDADVIFHQAAQAGVRTSVEQPQKVSDINISGTLNVLEAARDLETSGWPSRPPRRCTARPSTSPTTKSIRRCP